jgi:hypothetical protein
MSFLILKSEDINYVHCRMGKIFGYAEIVEG